MRIVITGICGFVGSSLARCWSRAGAGHELIGIDNLGRVGAAGNRAALKAMGVKLHHGDLRMASDVDALPNADMVIDAAANPSVLAGADGKSSSRQVVEHNLQATLNLLEYCRARKAGFILLSTSRVYSIAPLASLPLHESGDAFVIEEGKPLPNGITSAGVSETFSTTPSLSLYGSTKAASELMALEYGSMFDFPVWINRCGVMAGAGQFGHAEQGIFSFWLHAWRAGRLLRYIGFGGRGLQVRDMLHPEDLMPVLDAQLAATGEKPDRICNLSGGIDSAMSLRQLSNWCADRFGPRDIGAIGDGRAFDVPWLVLDSTRAADQWGFSPRRKPHDILEEIAAFAEANPTWLDDVAP